MSKYFDSHYDVVVISSGLSAMSLALNLIKEGYKVLLLDQHNLPGGMATSFIRNDIEYEASLHQMMSIGSKACPLRARTYLESFGVDVDWVKVPTCYRYKDKDIDIVLHPGVDGDFSIPIKDIASVCNEEGVDSKLQEFFDLCLYVHQTINSVNFKKTSKVTMMKKYQKFVQLVGYSYVDVCKAIGLPQRAIDILSAYWIYLGSPVDELPFIVYGYLLADYIGYGSYIPRHTSYEMALKMHEAIMKMGGQVELEQKVEKILVQNNKAYGVRTSLGEEIYGDIIVSGVFPHIVYDKMIEPSTEITKRMRKVANSFDIGVSCFSLFLLLDKSPKELNIQDYETFYTPNELNTKEIFENAKRRDRWDYLTSVCPNIILDNESPEGTCVYSITYLPLGEAFKDVTLSTYQKYKDECIEKLLTLESERLGVNLKDHIIDITVATPLTISRYTNAYLGSIYGYRHSMKNNVGSRTMLYKEEELIKNLYFCGAFGPGGDGMAPAIDNGRLCSLDIIENLKKRKNK